MATIRTEQLAWRAFLIPSLGLVAVAWSLITLPLSVKPTKHTIERVLADDRFNSSALNRLTLEIEAPPQWVMRAEVLRAEALIALLVAEDLGQIGSAEHAELQVAAAGRKLRSSLAMSPADSFLWLMLYSTTVFRFGFEPTSLIYLEQSYVSGPLEGWISLRRNRLALAVFPMLDDRIKAKAIREFAGLVDAGFIDAAAQNLMGVGWDQHERLLSSLASADRVRREALARILWREGVKASVPGVDIDERSGRVK